MNMKRNVSVLLCAALALSLASPALAAGFNATYSTQTVYVDGRQLSLDTYHIDGTNYVKLRDVGQLLDVNVYWDGANVQIDTASAYTGEAPASAVPAQTAVPAPTHTPTPAPATTDQPYTISVDHWSREDFSRQANPAVFTGPYTRELYNAVRQTIVDQGTDRNSGANCAYCMVSKADYSAVKNAIGRLNGVLRYEHYVPKRFSNYFEWLDYYAVSAAMPENYQAAFDYIQPVIREVDRMGTGREKVTRLNDYLCTLLTYNRDKNTGIPHIFAAHERELEGACGTYAIAFKFLCQAANIPCITVSSTNHSWNLVYADGQWLCVDVTNNDSAGRNYRLLVPSVPHTDKVPEATEFLKELLVPGSTK